MFFDLVFFCQQSADFGGATFMVDAVELMSYLQAYDPGLLVDLQSKPVSFRKGLRARRVVVLDTSGEHPQLSWNFSRVEADNPPDVIDMAERFSRFCEDMVVDGGLVTAVRLRPGEALFIRDRLVLHGRHAFWGQRRLLKGVVSMSQA